MPKLYWKVLMLKFPKNKIFRSKEYKAYIRTLPCLVCGKASDPHHEVGGGIGIKGPDLFSIPLCREHHREREDIGIETFWDKYSMDRWKTIAETLARIWEIKENEGP